MSWMKRLCETYDNNIKFIADYSQEVPLCPLYHSIVTSQIEVTLSEDGEFNGARLEDCKVIIPVTEDSAGRAGSTVAPHGLSDQLSYVAGDLKDYVEEAKSQKANTERFARYISALERWKESEYSAQKVRVIYDYLKKATLTKNLIAAGILEEQKTGKLSGAKCEKYVVRFIVHEEDEPSETWKDKNLINQFQKFYLGQRVSGEKPDICYLTGKAAMTVANHPKVSGNAKLVSSNDMTDFTFRGRFANPEEAFAISYEASQKAHNALQWLITQQGYSIGGKNRRTFVCWSPSGKPVPSVSSIPGTIASGDTQPQTLMEYKGKIKRALNGHRENLQHEQVVIMAMEAATSGRLSITYYNELMGSDFIDRLENWYSTCAWEFTTFDGNKHPRQEVLTPLNSAIVRYAFGTQQGEMLKASDKVAILHYQRLLSCMLDKQPLPLDILKAVCQNASRPQNYTEGSHQRILSTACALLAKYHNDQNKGVRIEMSLDKTNNDRSYLYGRLLAVYDKIESHALAKMGAKRGTNASRMQSSFVQHPGRVQQILEDAVKPYLQKVGVGSEEYYKNLIGDITGLFKPEDLLITNKGLNDLYLIGYYLQRAEFNAKKNEDKGEK